MEHHTDIATLPKKALIVFPTVSYKLNSRITDFKEQAFINIEVKALGHSSLNAGEV